LSLASVQHKTLVMVQHNKLVSVKNGKTQMAQPADGGWHFSGRRHSAWAPPVGATDLRLFANQCGGGLQCSRTQHYHRSMADEPLRKILLTTEAALSFRTLLAGRTDLQTAADQMAPSKGPKRSESTQKSATRLNCEVQPNMATFPEDSNATSLPSRVCSGG